MDPKDADYSSLHNVQVYKLANISPLGAQEI